MGRILRTRMAPKKIIIDTDPGVGKLAEVSGPDILASLAFRDRSHARQDP